jgi:hypothetical protein
LIDLRDLSIDQPMTRRALLRHGGSVMDFLDVQAAAFMKPPTITEPPVPVKPATTT